MTSKNLNFHKKAVIEEFSPKLNDLGLSSHETKAYLTLLFHPSSSAGSLSKKTSIPDSKIYYALDSLAKKGMIIIQQGTPKLYKALNPKEAISNLKQQMKKEFNEKIRKADDLAQKLSPLYETSEGAEEIELAYILRGLRNITNKMNELIKSSQKEVTVLISSPSIFQRIKNSLIDAKKRDVKIKIALNSTPEEIKDLKNLGSIKLLNCPCCILISDMMTLITVSNWKDENCSAIMTSDKNMIRISKEYFENPKCCLDVRNLN